MYNTILKKYNTAHYEKQSCTIYGTEDRERSSSSIVSLMAGNTLPRHNSAITVYW